MSRDYRKLRVFELAHAAVLETYGVTARFPAVERFGLQSQIRRAAVSVAATIVEGSARRTTAEYLSFLNIASASATETRYLLGLSCSLGFVKSESVEPLVTRYEAVAAGLQAIIRALQDRP